MGIGRSAHTLGNFAFCSIKLIDVAPIISRLRHARDAALVVDRLLRHHISGFDARHTSGHGHRAAFEQFATDVAAELFDLFEFGDRRIELPRHAHAYTVTHVLQGCIGLQRRVAQFSRDRIGAVDAVGHALIRA